MTADSLVGSAVCAAVAALLAVWRSASVMETKILAMKDEIKRDREDGEKTETSLTRDLREGLRQLQSLVGDVRVIGAEQAVINRTVSTTLASIVDKLDMHERLINDHAASMALLRELMKIKKILD